MVISIVKMAKQWGEKLLDVQTYDTTEVTVADTLSNRVIQAFYPEIFATLGYPTRVKHIGQLWKYIDVMHETRTHYNISTLLKGLTTEEFELFKRVTDIVDDHAMKNYGRHAHATAALLRAMHALRLIKIATGGERPTVLEIGPGCGYLAMLLVMEGYPYIGTETVQAFYLYQSHMLERVAKTFHELVLEESDITTIQQPTPGSAIHIPWWKWYAPEPSKVSVSAGIMTANHVLCEMHSYSVGYLAVLARQILSNHPGGGKIVFESWGYPEIHHEGAVLRKFMQQGFRACHNELNASAMVLADHAKDWPVYEPDSIKDAPSRTVKAYATLSRLPRLKSAISKLTTAVLPGIREAFVTAVDRQRDAVRLPEFKADNPLSRRLSTGLTDVISRATVSERDIFGYLDSKYGTIPQHPDEAFFALIGTQHP